MLTHGERVLTGTETGSAARFLRSNSVGIHQVLSYSTVFALSVSSQRLLVRHATQFYLSHLESVTQLALGHWSLPISPF